MVVHKHKAAQAESGMDPRIVGLLRLVLPADEVSKQWLLNNIDPEKLKPTWSEEAGDYARQWVRLAQVTRIRQGNGGY